MKIKIKRFLTTMTWLSVIVFMSYAAANNPAQGEVKGTTEEVPGAEAKEEVATETRLPEPVYEGTAENTSFNSQAIQTDNTPCQAKWGDICKLWKQGIQTCAVRPGTYTKDTALATDVRGTELEKFSKNGWWECFVYDVVPSCEYSQCVDIYLGGRDCIKDRNCPGRQMSKKYGRRHDVAIKVFKRSEVPEDFAKKHPGITF